MIIIIDNYDSFTYNLVHYVAQCGEQTEVIRNDKSTAESIIERKPKAIIFSPGPCDPTKAGICVPLIQKIKGTIPIFGVCLGFQSLIYAYGGKIIRSPFPVHGKAQKIAIVKQTPIFKDLPDSMLVTRYHSLCADSDTLPDCFDINAISNEKDDHGLIMAVTHKEYPYYGVQFHPESIRTEYGMSMIKNFIATLHHHVA